MSFLPPTLRCPRPSSLLRPRAFPSTDSHRFADVLSAKKSRPFFLSRLVPTGAVISTVALAFFVFGVLVSRNISTFVVASNARPSSSSSSSNSSPSVLRPVQVQNVSHSAPRLDAPPQPPPSSPLEVIPQPPSPPINEPPSPPLEQPAPPQQVASNSPGTVNWNRSWPISESHDLTHLIPLSKHVSFSNRTLINYFHMHKTGGVTTKVELMYIVNRAENVRQLTKRGQRLRYAETCYKKQIINPNDKSIENMWRCDFGQLKQFPEQNLSAIDIVMGHQYWNSGCDFLFAKHRDVRYFSIFRHPLPRKLSFFYHFFVRNMGKDEAHVGKEEVISFLLGDSLPNDSRVRDAGPNYYASRMLSDGVEGFVKHRYTIKKSDEGTAIRSVKYKLDNRYVFVGLQMQTAASQCMLQKTVQLLAHAHGIDEMVGTPKLSESKQRLNAGGYSWTAEKVWHAMTSEQKLRYKEVESVDLAIYKEVVDKFKKDVKLFSCEHRVDEQMWLEDIFE